MELPPPEPPPSLIQKCVCFSKGRDSIIPEKNVGVANDPDSECPLLWLPYHGDMDSSDESSVQASDTSNTTLSDSTPSHVTIDNISILSSMPSELESIQSSVSIWNDNDSYSLCADTPVLYTRSISSRMRSPPATPYRVLRKWRVTAIQSCHRSVARRYPLCKTGYHPSHQQICS